MSTSDYSGSYAINGATAPDNYLNSSTQTETHGTLICGPAVIEGVKISWFVIDVVNQIIFWQLKLQTAGFGGTGVWESAEKQMIPGSKQIVRPNLVGIRFRAATPLAVLQATNPAAVQAVVTVEAVT